MCECVAVRIKPHYRLCCQRRSLPDPVVLEPATPSSASGEVSPIGSRADTEIPEGPIVNQQEGEYLVVVQGFGLIERPHHDIPWETPDYRIYVVWLIPALEIPGRFCGIRVGFQGAAYSGLLGLNRLRFEGLRWRRVDGHQQATQLYRAEAHIHGVLADPLRFFLWRQQ